MWNYNRAYQPLLPYSERIALHAETEFFRSLNKNRLIAFIGSGIALPYGRITWSELCALLIMDVDERFWQVLKQHKEEKLFNPIMKEVKELHNALRIIVGEDRMYDYNFICNGMNGDYPDDSDLLLTPTLDKHVAADTTMLELCSDLAFLLDQQSTQQEGVPYFLKRRAAKYLMEGSIGQFESRLKLVDGYGEESLYKQWLKAREKIEKEIKKENPKQGNTFVAELKKLSDGQQGIFKHKLLKTHFKEIWLTEDKKFFKRKSLEELPWKYLRKQLKESNSLNELFEDLVYILRCASLRNAKISQGTWANPIKTLVDKLNIKRFVTLNYDTEIERYFILTKGYEVKENDPLLSPQHPQRSQSEYIAIRRNGFGSQLTSVTLEKNMVGRLINFAADSKQNDSYIFHLHGRGDCPEDLILTEKDYQELYVKSSKSQVAFVEGINTLFGGNDLLFLGVGMEETDLLQPLRQFVSESRKVSLRHDGILALLDKVVDTKKKDKQINNFKEKENQWIDLKATEKKALNLHTAFGVKTMFYNPKTRRLRQHYEHILNEFKIKKESKESKLKLMSYKLELMHINRKIICSQSQSFNQKLIKLAEDQQKWWKEWKTPPGKRVARFFDWSENTKPNQSKIWIRQKICLLPNDSEKVFKKGKIKHKIFTEIIKKIKNPEFLDKSGEKPKRRDILRYTGSAGVGKGTIVHALQAYCRNEMTVDKYVGCFFSDAKFSTEYTSVISALSRFLAGIIADKIISDDLKHKKEKSKFADRKNINSFKEEAEETHTFNSEWVKKNLGFNLPCGKTKILQKYLDEFKKNIKQGSNQDLSPRILVCLSGLDRLVDTQGYAYNALHRDFFKVLIHPDNEDVPLTLILISGKPDLPIRYLSNIDINKNQANTNILEGLKIDGGGRGKVDGNEKIPWDCQKAPLKGWTIIHKTELHERQWLPVCKGFSDGNACDEFLGFPSESMTPESMIERTSLAQVAKNYLSVHLWLRILLNLIYEEENADKVELLDSLELAASRDGVNGVVDRLLNIYETLDTEPKENRPLGAYQTILRHLALFSVPVERAVLANCPEVVKAVFANDDNKRRSEKSISLRIDGFLQTLNRIGLIIKIEKSGSSSLNKSPIDSKDQGADYRYALASIIRKHLAKRTDFDAYTHGEFSFFDVSLYPTQPLDLPSPKERDFVFIGKILQNIISNARYNLKYLKNFQTDDNGQDSINSLSRTIRAAVNLVNGSFSIGVVSRLEKSSMKNIELVCGHAQPFEAYSRWLRCLSNIAVAIEQKRGKNKILMPLYETEAAWIYNEQGLVNLIQGRLFDSLQLFRIAKERLDCSPWVDPDDTESYPSLTSLRRVELNYAIAMMESGMIKDAESEFFRLYQRKETNLRNDTSLTAHLACGYLGLCYHLQGRITQAEERYKEVLRFSRKENKNYLRVTAIFRHHYGNLKRGLNDFENSELFLNISIEAAASAKQMDIFHHASVSRAKLLLSKSEKGYAAEAISLLSKANAYAKKMGLFKLQVNADIIRGEVLISQKQYVVAGKLLANAIAMANKHGMRIMKIRALEVYAKALINRGTDKKVTDDILLTAKRLSENTGYLIKWVKEE